MLFVLTVLLSTRIKFFIKNTCGSYRVVKSKCLLEELSTYTMGGQFESVNDDNEKNKVREPRIQSANIPADMYF